MISTPLWSQGTGLPNGEFSGVALYILPRYARRLDAPQCGSRAQLSIKWLTAHSSWPDPDCLNSGNHH